MRRAARIDADHPQIRGQLRDLGADVLDLFRLGEGVPDMLVYWPPKDRFYLFEIKSEDGTLTPAEQKWHDDWGGPVYIIRSIDDALAVLGLEEA